METSPGRAARVSLVLRGLDLLGLLADHIQAPAGALLDWCDVRGVDLEAFVVRKAAGDRVVLDDRTSLLGDVLGARALLECVER